MKFVLKNIDHNFSGEKFVNKKSPVTNIGYVSIRKQVQLMTAAGEKLQQSRSAALYDFPDGVIDDDVPMDPTQNEGFDLFDAHELARSLKPVESEVSTSSELSKAPEALELDNTNKA